MTLHGLGAGLALPNYGLIAQGIRDAAGIPSTEDVGPRYATGHDTTATLTAGTAFAITSEATATSAGRFDDGGTGIVSDPYIMRDMLFDNTGAQPINWTDAAATYHLKCVNCHFTGHTTFHALRIQNVPSTASIVFENCTIEYGAGSSSATSAIASVTACGADITLDRCNIPSTGNQGVSMNGAHTGGVTIVDCSFSDSGAAWQNASSACIRDNSTDSAHTISITYTSFDFTTNNSMPYAVRLQRAINTATEISNCSFAGCGTATAATGAITQGGATSSPSMNVTYCRFYDQIGEHVYLTFADACEFSYCEFLDNSADRRGVYFSDVATNIDDIEVHHCKFTKTTGTATAGNECLESTSGTNIVFHDNWVSICPEDAIEMVSPGSGNQVYDCVGDSVTGQIVDIFNAPANPVLTVDTVVRGIYGTAGTDGVNLSNVQGGTVSRVVVAAGSVTPTDVGALNLDDEVNNFSVYGPIINSGSGEIISVDSLVAASGNTVGGVIGVNAIADVP